MLQLAILSVLVSGVLGEAGPVSISKVCKLDNECMFESGAVLLMPKSTEYQNAAGLLRESFKNRGWELSVTDDFNAVKNIDGTVIAIGHVTNNALIGSLYWNHYTTMTTAGYLGKGGYSVETVFGPMPYIPKGKVIVLGCANPNSAEQACRRFLELLAGKNSFEPTYELHIIQSKVSSKNSELYKNKANLSDFVLAVKLYRQTADACCLEIAKGVLLRKAEAARHDPNWMPDWQEEIQSWRAIQYWDGIAEFANLGEEERLKIEKLFIELPGKLVKLAAGYPEFGPECTVNWNHATVPTLGIYCCARYFECKYGLKSEMAEYMSKSKYLFENAIPYYRPMEESPGYTVFAAEYNLYYYLITGNEEFYRRGNVQKIADLMFVQTDNNGYFADQGDIPSPYCVMAQYQGFEPIDYYLNSGEFYWFAQRSPGTHAACLPFHENAKPVGPTRYVGMKAVGLDKGIYDYACRRAFDNEPVCVPGYDVNQVFDKLQFRSSVEQTGEYMLVDGFGRGKHMHLDTGAIICYSAGGYKFIADADYLCKKSSDHTMLNVIRNGHADLVPGYAGLMASADLNDAAFACAQVKNYNGVTWDRNICWVKEKYFLVMDKIRAQEDANYAFDCTWKVLNRGMETFDGQNLNCKAPIASQSIIDPKRQFGPVSFWLKSTEAGHWMNGRVSSSNLPTHRVHQNKKMKMSKGEEASFGNLFYIERKGADAASCYTPRRVNKDAVLIEGKESDYLALMDNCKAGKYQLDGKFALIGNGLFAVETTKITLKGGVVFESSCPVSIRIAGSEAVIDSPAAGKCSIGSGDDAQVIEFEKGSSRHKLRAALPEVCKDDLFDKGKEAGGGSDGQGEAGVKTLKPSWYASISQSGKARDLFVYYPVEGGKEPVIIAAAGNTAVRFEENGNKAWSYEYAGGISAVTAGKIDDNEISVLLGTNDSRILVLNAGGKLVREVNIPVESSGRYGTRTADPQYITKIRIIDIDKCGKPEIVIGMRTWQVQMYDANFKQKWFFTYNYHGVKDLDVLDMDNDGKLDILTADGYGSVRILDWESKDYATSIKTHTSIGDTVMAAIDTDDDGVLEIINASDTGEMAMFSRPKELKLVEHDGWDAYYPYDRKWSLNNFGYAYVGVIAIPGKKLIAGSETGYIYGINAKEGVNTWASYLDSSVSCVAGAGEKVLAGTEKGSIYKCSDDGKIESAGNCNSKVVKIVGVSGTKAAAITTDGFVYMFEM